MVYRISSNERTYPVNLTGHQIRGEHFNRGHWVPCERPNLKCTTRDQEVAGSHIKVVLIRFLPMACAVTPVRLGVKIVENIISGHVRRKKNWVYGGIIHGKGLGWMLLCPGLQ